MNEYAKQKQDYRYIKQSCGYQKVVGMELTDANY